jgi:mannose-6-phosphate isomerase-like protein (cupin superfamily)
MEMVSRAAVEPFVTKDGSTIRELLRSGSQSLAEATVGPRQATVRHFHEASEELYVFLDGGGRLEIGDEALAVAAGDSALIPRGARHAFTAGDAGARFLCCCVPPYTHEDTYLAP